MNQRLDGAGGQGRADGEGHARAVEPIDQRQRQRRRQSLPARAFRKRQRAPAALHILRIGFLEARRGSDYAVFEPGAVFVAGLVQGRDDAVAELAHLFHDRRNQIITELGKRAGRFQRGEAGGMIENKAHVADRRSIGHFRLPECPSYGAFASKFVGRNAALRKGNFLATRRCSAAIAGP